MRTHQEIDRRALAMDRLIADKIREKPGLVEHARLVLARWIATSSPDVQPALREWSEILELPLDEILTVVEGADERATRLRQSSPFCGMLTRAERTRILLEHERNPSNCESRPA